MIGVGLGTLGLDPRAFWRMTPREISAAIRGRLGPADVEGPPSRGEVAALMNRFPDK